MAAFLPSLPIGLSGAMHLDTPFMETAILLSTLAAAIFLYSRARVAGRSRSVESKNAREFVADLLEASDNGGQDWVEAVLEWSARSMEADKAWLLIDKRAEECRTWSNAGSLLPAEAEALTQAAITRFAWQDNRIFIAPNRRTAIVHDQPHRRRSSFRSAMVLLRSSSKEETAILGLSSHRALHVRSEATQAVSSVLQEVLQLLLLHRNDRRRSMHRQDEVLERRMETIGAFASGMAHNLNNVIAAIAGFNAITEMHVAPDSIAGRSAIDIDISIRRAQEIVHEVLSFGRRLERPSLTVDVGDLLAETAALLSVSLPSRVKLECGAPVGKWQVMGNFGHLQQVLLNICNNAAQAMVTGGTIQVECRSVVLDEPRRTSLGILDTGPYVAIGVADSGVGMSPATVARIFDPFFTARAGGTGLGLSTARDIIGQHGGAIDVHSLPSEGSTFTIWLPAAPPVSLVEKDAVPTGSGEVVLVVNADAARLMIDEELVAALGYEPFGVCDARTIGDVEEGGDGRVKAQVDAVLITGIDEEKIVAALDAVHRSGWSVPVLVAAAAPVTIAPLFSLSYPLDQDDLALALSQALSSHPACASADGTDPQDATIAPSERPLAGILASEPLRGLPFAPQAVFDEPDGRTEVVDGSAMLAPVPLHWRSARFPAAAMRAAAVLHPATSGNVLRPLSVALLSVALTTSSPWPPHAGVPGHMDPALVPRRADGPARQIVDSPTQPPLSMVAVLPTRGKQAASTLNGTERIADSPARLPLPMVAVLSAREGQAASTSNGRRPASARRAVTLHLANAHVLALVDRLRSTHGETATDRAALKAASRRVPFFSSVHAAVPMICRRYVAARWTTIGILPASDCLRRGFAWRSATYVKIGGLILSRGDDPVFRLSQRTVRRLHPTTAKAATGALIEPRAVLASINPFVCRRFDGSTWRKLGTMTARYCAEQAFAKPGTGYVQSGALSLSRHDDRIGILQGTRWRPVARIRDDKNTQSTVMWRNL